MTWDFHYQGFPPDLDKRFTTARTKAEVAFRKAKAGRPPSDVRRFLIDVRILPEVIAYAGCMCEMARREHVRVSEIEPYVDSYLRAVARTLCPDEHIQSASSEPFVREVVQRVTESDEWDAYLTKRLSVTEPLTADSASTEVERREETPATSAAGAVEESQTEPDATEGPAPSGPDAFDSELDPIAIVTAHNRLPSSALWSASAPVADFGHELLNPISHAPAVESIGDLFPTAAERQEHALPIDADGNLRRGHFTVAQAAKWLQVSQKTIRREILAGRLPATRVGRTLRIDGKDLAEYKRRYPAKK
jgi:excisionase family DNA binding protein